MYYITSKNVERCTPNRAIQKYSDGYFIQIHKYTAQAGGKKTKKSPVSI
jgi:hypothetical protein